MIDKIDAINGSRDVTPMEMERIAERRQVERRTETESRELSTDKVELSHSEEKTSEIEKTEKSPDAQEVTKDERSRVGNEWYLYGFPQAYQANEANPE